ncbi:hypothetical protein ACOMHN_045479 [Nucella lapillus]
MDASPGLQRGNNTNPNASGETSWNDTIEDKYIWSVQPFPEAIVVPVIFGLIFVVGLIGNGTLIFTVAVNKKWQF